MTGEVLRRREVEPLPKANGDIEHLLATDLVVAELNRLSDELETEFQARRSVLPILGEAGETWNERSVVRRAFEPTPKDSVTLKFFVDQLS